MGSDIRILTPGAFRSVVVGNGRWKSLVVGEKNKSVSGPVSVVSCSEVLNDLDGVGNGENST
ncbi:hypothetical protein Cflav_PD5138 [Pedosphaera parvula Ellin514]|uniref:Uncharacterized protein n=1 Tax=Pedosphaera parvula (strain Ellin514) TaxID=320771 RepID=B9XC35_PEDPL|nr:hypothetical protein Cflav_PD5138 [Pedosphaera parvula Ellin514]